MCEENTLGVSIEGELGDCGGISDRGGNTDLLEIICTRSRSGYMEQTCINEIRCINSVN